MYRFNYSFFRHDFLIAKPYGSRVQATAGYIYVLRATAELWTRSLTHLTQIIYTPDIATIIANLDLRPGGRVAESGTGSGSMTHSLCRCVHPDGHVYSFDVDERRVRDVGAALHMHGFTSALVTVAVHNVCTSGGLPVPPRSLDAVLLDVPSPWLAIDAAVAALRRPGRICTFSPCIEQVQKNCDKLKSVGFHSIETITIVPRAMKVRSFLSV